MNAENVTLANKLFDLSTMDIEKFKDVIRITSYIVHDTGLQMTGQRSDGGVIGFGIPNDERSYLGYNIDHGYLFVNYDVLTGTQQRSAMGIASMFDLTIKEYDLDD